MDVWIRKIIGWEIHTEESEVHAREFLAVSAITHAENAMKLFKVRASSLLTYSARLAMLYFFLAFATVTRSPN